MAGAGAAVIHDPALEFRIVPPGEWWRERLKVLLPIGLWVVFATWVLVLSVRGEAGLALLAVAAASGVVLLVATASLLGRSPRPTEPLARRRGRGEMIGADLLIAATAPAADLSLLTRTS